MGRVSDMKEVKVRKRTHGKKQDKLDTFKAGFNNYTEVSDQAHKAVRELNKSPFLSKLFSASDIKKLQHIESVLSRVNFPFSVLAEYIDDGGNFDSVKFQKDYKGRL